MNKLLQKVAKIFLGLSMAAGVGVAVSAKVKSPESVNATDGTITFSDGSFSNNEITWTDGSPTHLTVKQEKNTGQTTPNSSYVSSPRWYSGNKVTFTPASGVTITSMTITATSSAYATELRGSTVSSGDFGGTESTVTWSGSASEAFYVVLGGQCRLSTSMTFVYSSGGGGGGSGGDVITSSDLKATSTQYTAFSGVIKASGAVYLGKTAKDNSGNIQCNATSGNGIATSGSGGKIKEIAVSWGSTPGSGRGYNVYGSNTAYASVTTTGTSLGTLNASTTSITVSGDYEYVSLQGTGGATYAQSITFTWESVTKYTVTFNANGHGTAPSSQSIVSGEKASEPTAPTATGYTFGGWYKEQACTNAWNFSSDTVDDDTTLWAKWTVKSSALTFNLNGGSGTAPTGKTATYGSAMPTYGESAPTKTGYTFGGFYDGSGGTGTQYYTAGLASARTWDKNVTTATILYAKWTAKTSALTFNLNTGSGTAPTGKTATYGSAMPAYGQSAPTKTGYTFAGFYDGEGGTGTQYYTASLVSARTWDKDTTDGTTLYAKWTINSYSVTGTISNGELSSEDNVNYNEALSITIVPDTANDYTYPASIESVTMGGDPYNGYTYDSSDGSFYIEHVTGNVVIVAHCVDTSATPYHLDYDLDNCSITNAPETIYSNEIKELQIVPNDHYKLPLESDNKVSVSGIDSTKWSYDEDDGTITISEPDGNMTVSIECIAKAQNTISVGTLTGVSKVSGPSSVEEGDSATLTFTADSGYGLPGDGGVSVTGTETYVWNQNTGELELLGETSTIIVSITGIQRDLTDGSLTLGSKKDEYTLGDDFELPATVVANFNIAPTTVDVKNDVEVSGPVTKNNDKYVVTGNGTVTLTYTFSTTRKTQSASYDITATPITPSSAEYRKVTSISAGTYLMVYEEGGYAMSTTQGSNNRDSVSVTISDSKITSVPATAQVLTVSQATIDNKTGWQFYTGSGYLYAASSSSNYLRTQTTNNANGLFTANFSGGDVTLTAQGSNTRNIIRFNTASDQLKFSCYGSTSALPVVQLYKYYPAIDPELKWITATVNTGTYYQGSSVNSSNFTVTAHYNGGSPQSEVVTENITVTNGYLANIGDNLVTLTYGGKSYNVNVVAVEQTATLTGLTWAQGELTIIDGHAIDFTTLGTVTATYDTSPSSHVALDICTVSTYTKSNDTYTKVSDIDDGDTISSTSHGKYLGVSYTEKGVTKVAYSSAAIYVVEEIEDVFIQEPTTTWSKVTSLAEGDIVTFVNESASEVASSHSSNIIHASAYEDTVSSEFYFEVGKVGDYYTFHNEGGYLGNHSTGTKSNNYAYLDSEIDEDYNYNYFTVSFSEGSVVITSVYDSQRTLQFNGDRFCFYGSSQASVELYKGTAGYSPSDTNIANTNAVVQKAVLEFAEHFNDTMECVNNGSTANVSTKWTTLSGDFTTALSGFSEDNLTHFKALFANAYSVEGGDTLQDMLARYDYIVAKYKLSDFLKTAGRPEVAQSPHVSPLINIVGEKANSVAIIVIISMVSVTAIGGYFFLKKRKEEN